MTLLPELPLSSWKETKLALHLFAQLVGKTRLALNPRLNHWWHVPLYVSPAGLTTQSIPSGDAMIDIEIDLQRHALIVRRSDGWTGEFSLEELSVSEFFDRYRSLLASAGVTIRMIEKPFGMEVTAPFAKVELRYSDTDAVRRYHELLLWAEPVFRKFRGRFIGKCSPVHVFWHSFDLAVTRFSGRRAPAREGADPVSTEAYSHEVISAGLWVGDDKIAEPAFYTYAAPEPEGLADEALRPPAALWSNAYGGNMALLRYSDVRASASPERDVLDFLQSSYEAGAKRASWARQDLEA